MNEKADSRTAGAAQRRADVLPFQHICIIRAVFTSSSPSHRRPLGLVSDPHFLSHCGDCCLAVRLQGKGQSEAERRYRMDVVFADSRLVFDHQGMCIEHPPRLKAPSCHNLWFLCERGKAVGEWCKVVALHL